MREYKTSERIRKRSIQYYWDHREERLRDQEQRRRQQGVLPRRPARTAEEKLAAKVVCKCGRSVDTPSLLLKSSKKCIRCSFPKHFTTEAARLRSQQHRTSPTSSHGRFWTWKAAQVCVDCGIQHTKANPLDLHHRDPATKLFKISRGLYMVSQARLWAEIAKCEILCKWCHKKRH